MSESGSGAAVEDASVEEEPADAVADQGDGAAVVGTPQLRASMSGSMCLRRKAH